MVKMRNCFGKICLAAIIISFATPFVSTGQEHGHDWYCSDPKAHAEYEAHFKKHLDNSAEVITDKLAEIYSSNLSQEDKKTKTIEILNNHLAKMKAGMGD